MLLSMAMGTSLIWVVAWDLVDVQGLCRAGLGLHWPHNSEERACTLPGQHRRACPGGRDLGEPNLRASAQ